MSDEMPYTSTRYRDMTEEMAGQFKAAFLEVLDEAIEKENPDIILCHHLYYLTALIRAHYPAKKVYGFCHNTDLRQMESILFERNFIRQEILKRLSARKAFQCLSSHRYNFPFRCLSEKLHILRKIYL